MSQAGIASRRAAEDLIREGRVTVNGKVAQLGDKADLAHDTVKVDGEPLKAPEFVYFLLNKPRGVVSTNKPQPQEKRRIVRDLIPYKGHLFTVGRLDADSEGLILLTNDGELADKLMHPRYGHNKTYEVLVEGVPAPKTLDVWREGVVLRRRAHGSRPRCVFWSSGDQRNAARNHHARGAQAADSAGRRCCSATRLNG